MEHRCNVLARRRAGLLAGCMAVGLGALGLVAGPATARPRHAPKAQHATKTKIRASAAYSGCWGTGPTVRDFRGARYGTRYCHNYLGGTVGFGTTLSGYLYAGNNWFVCQSRGGENPRVGSARNNIWLYTQGDKGVPSWAPGYHYHGWGWFPATYVSGGINYGPIPGLRWC